MKKVVGYSLFLIGLGILLTSIIPGKCLEIIISLACLIIGYNLFCSCD